MLLKRTLVCVFGVLQCVSMVQGSKNTFSTYCTLFFLHLSETHRFLWSSSFWDTRLALIGQISSALWLAEYIKRVTEILRPFPCCDAVSRRDDIKTIKPIINEVFVVFSEDIIIDYNDSYSLFMHRAEPRKYYVCMCDRRNGKQALLYTAQNSRLNCQ